MVTPEVRVAILDFGLVADRATENAPAGGTPAYMAPEQRGGPEADMYAVGVILHKALTGALPGPGARLPSDLGELCAALLDADPGRAQSGHSLPGPPAAGQDDLSW